MTFYLGCPIWSSKRWVGTLFPKGTPPTAFLHRYSRQFSTVEGNTTFYATPTLDRMAQWRDETPPGFRFCCKVPQEISHVYQLQRCEALTQEWIAHLRMLQDRAGPCFLQLPASFSPVQFEALAQYLKRWSPDVQLALEVRHPGWFEAPMEQRLNNLLSAHHHARVLYDVRGLESAERTPTVRAALQRKPSVPVRFVKTAPFVFVRYISHPDPPQNDVFFEEWVQHLLPWLQTGTDVYFFMHHIDDFYMPILCERLHERLSKEVPLPPLVLEKPPVPAQTSLW